MNGKRLATPLFAVLVLVELTDLIFAVDSVPAVLAVSHEQFIVFSSNAFAILGLRSMYFLLAHLHGRFRFLQQGLAVILAFVGVKMIVSEWVHIATWISLVVIAVVLLAAIACSLWFPGEQDDPAGHGDGDQPPPAIGCPTAPTRCTDPGRNHPMAIADEDIERLRSTVSIVDVIGQVVTLRKVGRNWQGLCPFHAEKSPSFNVREETGRYKCFGCDKARRRVHVRPGARARRLRRGRRDARRPGRACSSRYTSTGQSKERAQRKRLVEAMGDGDRVVPRAAARGPGRPPGPRLPPRPVALPVTSPASSSSAGRPTTGTRCRAGPASRRAAADDRTGVPQPPRPPAGRLPGPRAVPDLQRHRRGGGDRRAGPARLRRSGEVQELAGDADLRQVQDALRVELGQGRHRRRRPGRRLRGLHRRDRLPPRRRQAGRGHVRDGVHRGPRPADQALRQPGRAGVRRRRRRPGRGRALLRVGAAAPGAGRGRQAARRPRSRRAGRAATPTRWPRRSPTPCRSWPSASTG